MTKRKNVIDKHVTILAGHASILTCERRWNRIWILPYWYCLCLSLDNEMYMILSLLIWDDLLLLMKITSDLCSIVNERKKLRFHYQFTHKHCCNFIRSIVSWIRFRRIYTYPARCHCSHCNQNPCKLGYHILLDMSLPTEI